jgi:hypothetical protein
VSLEEFPGPPKDLSARKLPLVRFRDSLFRTHHISHSPLYFGNVPRHRFDAPDGSYGVLYTGRDPYCAFIETFGRPAGTHIITTAALIERALTEIQPGRPVRLIDLTASGSLVRLGADARLFSGAYEVSRLWSKALHDHPACADGVLYPSRLDPARHSVALFSGRDLPLSELSRQSWYAIGQQRLLLARIVEHYRMDLIESRTVVQRRPPSSQGRLF